MSTEIIRADLLIERELGILEQAGCQFWACDGPDKPFVQMATCFVCSEIQDLREQLRLRREAHARRTT